MNFNTVYYNISLTFPEVGGNNSVVRIDTLVGLTQIGVNSVYITFVVLLFNNLAHGYYKYFL